MMITQEPGTGEGGSGRQTPARLRAVGRRRGRSSEQNLVPAFPNSREKNKQTPRCWEDKMPRVVVETQGGSVTHSRPSSTGWLQNACLHQISPGFQRFPPFSTVPLKEVWQLPCPAGHSPGTPPHPRGRLHFPPGIDFNSKGCLFRQFCHCFGAGG